MKILGYILIVVSLILGGTIVTPFSWSEYQQESTLVKKWYWKLLIFLLAIAIGVVGVKLIG